MHVIAHTISLRFVPSVLLAIAVFFGLGVASASAQTIVGVASGDPQFTSLVDSVVAADLVDTLNSDGPFTVFAPTNDAFGDLPAYVANALERNPELLEDILLYHVAAGELMAEDVLSMRRIETVQGESLRVSLRGGDPYVDDSMIIATDVPADNGVIHVIDEVLIPNSVYTAIIHDLRMQIRDLLTLTRDIRQDQLDKVRSGGRGHGWGN